MAGDGGIGTYLQALLPRIAKLRPQWSFSVLGNVDRMRQLGWGGGALPNVTLLSREARIFSLREQIEMPLRGPHAADLFWAPNYNVPLLLRQPLVVTIHDVNHLALPELMGGRLRRSYSRLMFASAVRRARGILFDSEFTRDEIGRVLGVGGGRTDVARGVVVHLAADNDWARAKELAPTRPLAEPYLLYIGNVKRHKNVPFLLRAFARVRDRIPHHLVLIGRTEGIRTDAETARALSSAGGRVHVMGEVSVATVRQHVAHADALVTASRYEGFGLPALEAMAAGCPCLVSAAGSLPEVCGDAALYGDPNDEEAFASRIFLIASDADLRARLAACGRARAARFSWDRAAQATLNVLEQASS
jgi:glycosyltransferase involved in cell wall biosynthesis